MQKYAQLANDRQAGICPTDTEPDTARQARVARAIHGLSDKDVDQLTAVAEALFLCGGAPPAPETISKALDHIDVVVGEEPG